MFLCLDLAHLFLRFLKKLMKCPLLWHHLCLQSFICRSFFLSVRFSATNQNSNQIHNANNNLNLSNYSILLSFFLDKKRNKKVKALNFYFVRKYLFYNYLHLVMNNFNSFLKLKFFKNVLAEILKINSFSSVAKTMKFKAEYSSLIITK